MKNYHNLTVLFKKKLSNLPIFLHNMFFQPSLKGNFPLILFQVTSSAYHCIRHALCTHGSTSKHTPPHILSFQNPTWIWFGPLRLRMVPPWSVETTTKIEHIVLMRQSYAENWSHHFNVCLNQHRQSSKQISSVASLNVCLNQHAIFKANFLQEHILGMCTTNYFIILLLYYVCNSFLIILYLSFLFCMLV